MSTVPLPELLRALLRRPGLWFEAVAVLFAVAERGWWARVPPVPRPDPAYVDWRIATAYGSAGRSVPIDDVLAYLEWRKLQRSRRV